MRNFLPKFMSFITRSARHRVDSRIVWRSDLWVPNLFVLWRRIFWEPTGITGDVSARVEGRRTENGEYIMGTTYYAFHTLEALLSHYEARVRGLFPKLAPVRIWIPMFQPVGSPMPVFASPYLFAIAYDTSGAAQSATGSSTSGSLSLTLASGASLWVGLSNANPTGDATSVNWNTSEALTNAVSRTPGGFTTDAIWYRSNPTSGAHDVTVTFSACEFSILAVSLTGTDSTPLGATGSNGGTATASTVSVTTTAENSLVVDMITVNGIQDLTATGSGQTRRVHFTHDVSSGWKDAMSTMTTTTTGAYVPAYSWSPSRLWNGVAVEVKALVTIYTISVTDTLTVTESVSKEFVHIIDGPSSFFHVGVKLIG